LSGFHYFHGCFQCVSSFFIDSFNVFSPFFIFSMFLHVLHQFSFVLNMCWLFVIVFAMFFYCASLFFIDVHCCFILFHVFFICFWCV
jgi:hypothetical protein